MAFRLTANIYKYRCATATRTKTRDTGSNYKTNAVFINESGLYALIMGSKLEIAPIPPLGDR